MAPGSAASQVVDGSIQLFSRIRRSDAWSQWRDLARDAPPFLTPEFFALSVPLATGVPLVAMATQCGRLAGALPLLLRGSELRSLCTEQTPRYDYWGAPDAIDAIWRVLRRDRRWSELLLQEMPAGAPLVNRLQAIARADRCAAVLVPVGRQRVLALPGFEARLDSRFRMGLHRCERKAGGVELERIARLARRDFAQAIAIEAMAWKASAGTDIASDPKVAHLYCALSRLLGARGRAYAYFLRVAGRRIAVVLTVEDEHTLYALKTGYDPQHGALSPGHLLFWKVAQDAEGRGLRSLEFLGRDAEWKRKWTEESQELVSLRIYQRSVRGLALHAAREVLKPRLPESMRDFRAPLRRGCQRADIIGAHSLVERVRGRLQQGLGIRSGIVHLLSARPARREPLGEPSRFSPGEWVRVLDAERIRETLDPASKLRGLHFIPQQWSSCGRVYRVQKQVRRMREDTGDYRPIARTVLLEGVTCAGDGPEPAGCGRHCPTMFRDEWLEQAARPRLEPAPLARRHARVRGIDEIAAGLDLTGRRDGLVFMPEMAQLAGRRFPVLETLSSVFEYDRWVEPRKPVHVLEGLHCSGVVPGEPGPCDRACALVWHDDWLLLERPRELGA